MRQHVFAFMVALAVWAVGNMVIALLDVRVYAQSSNAATTSGLDYSCNQVAELVQEVQRTCTSTGGSCTGRCIADFVTYGYCGLPLQSRYQCYEYVTTRPVWREQTDCVWRNGICTCGTEWTFLRIVGNLPRWWCDKP